uniref:SH3 domain-containing protein n=1 Tax=Heterorhabditis bacteriophora TaxID=37862 RepID=A0A1I7WWA5_HETBA
MSSVEEFKTDSLKSRIGKITTSSTSIIPIPLSDCSDTMSEKILKTEIDQTDGTESYNPDLQEQLPMSVIDEDDVIDLPTTSSQCDAIEQSGPYAVLATEDNGPKRRKLTRASLFLEYFALTTDGVIPSTSGWTPVVVSLSELDRPRSSSFSRQSDEQGDGSDIKVEITRFLEELIDKHPETLDAIENVRLSRLSRAAAHQRAPPILRLHGSRRRPSTSVTALSDLALRDGTHVASGHEDTSQGAVHSFQDEDGTWWTYAFDEHGVGTAQPLGSGRALMELLQSGQEMPVGMSRLDGEVCCLQQTTMISGRAIASTRFVVFSG